MIVCSWLHASLHEESTSLTEFYSKPSFRSHITMSDSHSLSNAESVCMYVYTYLSYYNATSTNLPKIWVLNQWTYPPSLTA